MSAVGMKHLVAAPIASEPTGQAITYGHGLVMGPARAANINFERNTDPLYGDDVEQDNDNGITGGTIDTETTQMTGEQRVALLGEKAVENSDGEYEGTDAAAPHIGLGFLQVIREKDMTTQRINTRYWGWWFYKVQFGETAISGATKEGKIAWQNPKVTGRMMGVYNDASGVAKFYVRKEFETASACIVWLDGKANIAAQAASNQTEPNQTDPDQTEPNH